MSHQNLSLRSISDDWQVVEAPISGVNQRSRDTPKPNAVYLLADLLVPGKGQPVPNQAVICENGTIVHVGPPLTVPSQYTNLEPITHACPCSSPRVVGMPCAFHGCIAEQTHQY